MARTILRSHEIPVVGRDAGHGRHFACTLMFVFMVLCVMSFLDSTAVYRTYGWARLDRTSARRRLKW
jgi:hypothetical protein